MRRIAREPLVHFAVLGAALFAVYGVVNRRGAPGAGGSSMSPVNGRIDIDQVLLERLGEGFRRAWKREPVREELAEMVLDHVNEEILYREAQRLRLDQDDPAVRRRMIEKVTVMRQPQTPVPEPSEAELRRWFSEHPHHFHQPDRFWFRQLFFDPRRRASLNEDAARALDELRHDGEDGRRPVPGAGVGDVSSLPPVVEGMPALQVAHLFG
ncbi:MAG TPA: peptidylprolyl isomerase, partial [Polyangia bacterium]|nr:peptidylprolyl isomerase [Polyangia bacterium]